MSTITSANSTFSIAITNLYPTPVTISGYAADDAFTADAVDMTETVIGVDGILSAGFVFNPVNMTLTIMPTSPSLEVFENWQISQRTAREVYNASAVITLPAIGRKYTLFNGYLVSGKPFPDNKRTLQPLPFVIRWERIVGEATA